ncbi:uncharacterized protein PHALS_05058 [Plasmopara halstedii]|uniref:Uncharacterized protein n=1 Tax=Plasmopara halstedii TaxID=4781 RepID=A0A0N7L422_PLAHL|nr:uncharacterized protein PHALS_05058 [Plasmopara halstedii]CEG37467.1 hypothetical protein PHALS_05058 [Plasmopara halstedii]|eukprot:XP_024573836.1 hypothetical protein PHALS_05058 [Plasmopara halstedii]
MAGLNAPIFPNITTEYLNHPTSICVDLENHLFSLIVIRRVAMAENWDRPKQWQTKYA